MMRKRTFLIMLGLAACTPDPERAETPGERWAGDVSFRGEPAVGVLVEPGEGRALMIGAPALGVDSAWLDRFNRRYDFISFDWHVDGASRQCVLELMVTGEYLGPCNADGEPSIGFRLVPPGIDLPTGIARTLFEMSSIRWWHVGGDSSTHVYAPGQDSTRVDVAGALRVAQEARQPREDARAPVVSPGRRITVFIAPDSAFVARLAGADVRCFVDPLAGTIVTSPREMGC